MSYEGLNYERLYQRAYYLAIPALLAVIAIFQPFARPEPDNSKAFGCYVASAAPAIRLDRHGMTVLQKGFARIPYHLERHKTAVTLTADAPIKADLVNGSYVYSLYRPGIGTFLDFQRVEHGVRYGQFDDNDLTMFKMLARDGVELLYRKTTSTACGAKR